MKRAEIKIIFSWNIIGKNTPLYHHKYLRQLNNHWTWKNKFLNKLVLNSATTEKAALFHMDKRRTTREKEGTGL